MARYLAIDWDQNQLHVVAADVQGKSIRILKARQWQEGQVPNPANAEDLGRVLKEHLREAGIAPAPLVACLGRDRLIIKQIRFPTLPEAEEPAVVRFQTLKELTDAAEDVVIDYTVVKASPSASTANALGGDQRASALVIRKELLQTYQRLAEAAGLKLAALTPRLAGIAACLRKVMGTTVVTPLPEPADAAVCAVVVGEQTAEILVIKEDSVLLARSVPGGNNLAGEIRRNLAVHAGQQPHHPIRAVYVAGRDGAALQSRLGELIQEPVYIFDPFAEAANVELAPSVRGTFAGAVGLLHLRSSGETHINFVTPRQPRPATNPNYRLIRLALVAGVAVFVGLVVLGRVLHASWSDELAQVEEDRQRLEKQLNDTRENAKRLKAIDDWDNLVWLDELYDLTVRIPDVNALRITEIKGENLARTPRSRMAAKATIKGKLLSRRNPREPLDQLVTQFRKDGYYSTEAPHVENDQFTLVVYFERRPPGEYKYLIKEEKAPAETERRMEPEDLEEGEDGEEGRRREMGRRKVEGKGTGPAEKMGKDRFQRRIKN